MTGAQRDTLWDDAEHTLSNEQQLPLGPMPAEGSCARRTRIMKVRVGDSWYDLSYM
jgi:hypothetical protein